MMRSATRLRAVRRILVVESDRYLADAIALTLDDFEVTVAHDGLEALEALNDRTCDLIVFDFESPRLNGYAFHARLARQMPELVRRVIYLTSTPTPKERSFFQSIDNPVLEKPFEPRDLRAVVDAELAFWVRVWRRHRSV